ncbi:hypothetical protein XM38_014050 [Halomicronema hongdechloris C2206]|uniref:Uncharacterized protein n=1 Tax=Halomicronema hongdechloris C2206 TaxID=1641165 RepID=A0A1Z3HJM4_9CYAN|nr:hypothetical protein XM38_014050 [Halomicronema hongdechloris C2206]
MTLAKASETALIRGHKRLEDTTIQLMQLSDYSNGVGITFSASKTGMTHKILIWILSIMSS